MSQIIEETVKALTEFESALDKVKSDAAESKRQMTKNAGDWAESAKNGAVAEAQRIATRRLAKARREAEAEAESTRRKGEEEMKGFSESISKHRKEAAELVMHRLLGEER